MQFQDDLIGSINSEKDYREIQILLTKILTRAAPQFGCCILRRLVDLEADVSIRVPLRLDLVTNRIGQTYEFSVLEFFLKYFPLLQALRCCHSCSLTKQQRYVLIFEIQDTIWNLSG